jgi:hypothetical protein
LAKSKACERERERERRLNRELRREREREAMEKEREQQVYLARLAEQAERYDGMISVDLCRFSFCS